MSQCEWRQLSNAASQQPLAKHAWGLVELIFFVLGITGVGPIPFGLHKGAR